MVELKSGNLRDPFRLLRGSLHHDTVLVKVHVPPQIRHIAGKCFLIDRDPDRILRLNGHIHHLNKRNVLYPLVPVFEREEQRVIAVSSTHHHLHDLLICIMDVTLHMHCRNRIIVNDIDISCDQKNQQ